MNKAEILKALEDEHERFLDLIEDLPPEDLTAPGVNGDWSIKDIMAHINSWEAELIKLLFQARQGAKPTSIHFRGVNVDEINEAWHQERKSRHLEQVLDDFHAIRLQTIRRVNAFSDQELTDPKRFSWQKNIPLWRWIAENSFAHEAEHRQQVEAWLKNRQG